MNCTIFKLFSVVLSTSAQCGGPKTTLGDLHQISAVNALHAKMFSTRGFGLECSAAQLVLNKITPVHIDIEQISLMNICENHKSELTKNHKSVRHTTCSVVDCNRSGEKDQRVTYKVASFAYKNLGLRIFVGSLLCSFHRKNIIIPSRQPYVDIESDCFDSQTKSDPLLKSETGSHSEPNVAEASELTLLEGRTLELDTLESKNEMLRLEQNLAANEKTGAFNIEMRNLITSLQTHITHLTGEVTRYKKKVVEKELETAKLRKESYELRIRGESTILSGLEGELGTINGKLLEVEGKSNVAEVSKDKVVLMEMKVQCDFAECRMKKMYETKKEEMKMLEDQYETLKHKEETMLSDMEVTGKAYEDMEHQNSRLLQLLGEKEEANFKLLSERIDSNQIARLAREKETYVNQVATLTTQLEAQNQVLWKLEQKGILLQTNLTCGEKDLELRTQAREMHKKEAIESAQLAADQKLYLEKDQSQIKEVQETVEENSCAFEPDGCIHQSAQFTDPLGPECDIKFPEVVPDERMHDSRDQLAKYGRVKNDGGEARDGGRGRLRSRSRGRTWSRCTSWERRRSRSIERVESPWRERSRSARREISRSVSRPKRKSSGMAPQQLPKLNKFHSTSSSEGFVSFNSQTFSQGSTFSVSSEVEAEKKSLQFQEVLSFVAALDPVLAESISSPFDLDMKYRTLKRYAELTGTVVKLVFQSLIKTHDEETERSFWKMVVTALNESTLDVKTRASLALNVLDAISDFYSILVQDRSRTGITARKLVIQSVAGSKVQNSKQLNLLSKEMGARRDTVVKEVENRKVVEEEQKLRPFLELLSRKSPQGAGYVSEQEHRDIIMFYESDEHSDILKGHNQCFKELVMSEDGSKTYFYRSKRVLKVHLCDLLKEAQKQIGFKFSLSTLIKLRPPWVLLAREAHVLTCLCDRCQNMVLHLRPICNFVRKMRQHGSPADKAALTDFDLSPSLTEFVSKVLHPKPDESVWHKAECYRQECVSSHEFPCGPLKLQLLFKPLLTKFGSHEVQIIQHKRVKYTKVDGTAAYKFEQVESRLCLDKIVDQLGERMFGHKVHKMNYLEHRLKMLLATKMRTNARENLTENDIIVYTDFSKELEIKSQEVCKSEAFGASNHTIQIVGQVYELRVLKSGPPINLHFNYEKQTILFQRPKIDGGSRVQRYEVHIREVETETWYILLIIEVQYLSSEPKIPEKIFGRMSGIFMLRVYSCNLVGVGDFCEILVDLNGEVAFLPKVENLIPENHFVMKNLTCLLEYFFLSDHGDMPKTWRSIRKCKQVALSDIKSKFSRNVIRCITITDTGGENSGSSALCSYSFSGTDLGLESIWSPTCAHHSGQPSDSSCGTLKRWIKNDLKSGKATLLTSAESVVKYIETQPMMREVNQSKYLKARTVHRAYYHMTKEIVLEEGPGHDREVERLEGVSSYKQAWSIGTPYQLLVRKETCCCSECLSNKFENCYLREYTDVPGLVTFSPEVRNTIELRSTQVPSTSVAEEDEQISEPEKIQFAPVVGNYYAVFADNTQGFYLVKCLRVAKDKFSGIYLSATFHEDSISAFFKLTREKDVFHLKTIADEIVTAALVTLNTVECICVSKLELNDIISTIAEIDD